MNFKIKLIKLSNRLDAHSPNDKGDGERIGYMTRYPEVGQSFYITYGNNLFRGLQTSEVREVKFEEDGLSFKTFNSVYKIVILEKFPDEIKPNVTAHTCEELLKGFVSTYSSMLTNVLLNDKLISFDDLKEVNESFDRAAKYLLDKGIH
jgi:hypothetical protein